MKKLILILFFSIFAITVVLFLVFNFAVVPKKYKNLVVKYAEEYNVEPALVYAIIKVESNFDSEACSSAGALGLMQIMPSTGAWIASELGEQFENENLYDKEINIKYGCFYLNYLFSKFNNLDAVICAYNAGETIVKNWLNADGKIDEEKITYSETKNYYKKVLGFYNTYKSSKIFE